MSGGGLKTMGRASIAVQDTLVADARAAARTGRSMRMACPAAISATPARTAAESGRPTACQAFSHGAGGCAARACSPRTIAARRPVSKRRSAREKSASESYGGAATSCSARASAYRRGPGTREGPSGSSSSIRMAASRTVGVAAHALDVTVPSLRSRMFSRDSGPNGGRASSPLRPCLEERLGHRERFRRGQGDASRPKVAKAHAADGGLHARTCCQSHASPGARSPWRLRGILCR